VNPLLAHQLTALSVIIMATTAIIIIYLPSAMAFFYFLSRKTWSDKLGVQQLKDDAQVANLLVSASKQKLK